MTAVQLNAMSTELWQSIGAIADSEPLMRRLTRYAKKLVKEKNDPTLLTKEAFFARVDAAREEIRKGKCKRFSDPEEMNAWLNSLGLGEELKGDRSGQWSRTITKKHCLIYEIFETEVYVDVLSAFGHYDDK